MPKMDKFAFLSEYFGVFLSLISVIFKFLVLYKVKLFIVISIIFILYFISKFIGVISIESQVKSIQEKIDNYRVFILYNKIEQIIENQKSTLNSFYILFMVLIASILNAINNFQFKYVLKLALILFTVLRILFFLITDDYISIISVCFLMILLIIFFTGKVMFYLFYYLNYIFYYKVCNVKWRGKFLSFLQSYHKFYYVHNIKFLILYIILFIFFEWTWVIFMWLFLRLLVNYFDLWLRSLILTWNWCGSTYDLKKIVYLGFETYPKSLIYEEKLIKILFFFKVRQIFIKKESILQYSDSLFFSENFEFLWNRRFLCQFNNFFYETCILGFIIERCYWYIGAGSDKDISRNLSMFLKKTIVKYMKDHKKRKWKS